MLAFQFEWTSSSVVEWFNRKIFFQINLLAVSHLWAYIDDRAWLDVSFLVPIDVESSLNSRSFALPLFPRAMQKPGRAKQKQRTVLIHISNGVRKKKFTYRENFIDEIIFHSYDIRFDEYPRRVRSLEEEIMQPKNNEYKKKEKKEKRERERSRFVIVIE